MDLEMKLHAAEVRRSDLQRAHQEAMSALRDCGTDLLDARQSRVRELEKKVALETVRCEELQLELASAQRQRTPASHSPHQSHHSPGHQLGVNVSYGYNNMTNNMNMGVSNAGPMQMQQQQQQHQQQQQQMQNMSHVTNMSNMTHGGHLATTPQKHNEIDRIMAKIEQDNRILAELDHTRSTTLGEFWCTIKPETKKKKKCFIVFLLMISLQIGKWLRCVCCTLNLTYLSF